MKMDMDIKFIFQMLPNSNSADAEIHKYSIFLFMEQIVNFFERGDALSVFNMRKNLTPHVKNALKFFENTIDEEKKLSSYINNIPLHKNPYIAKLLENKLNVLFGTN